MARKKLSFKPFTFIDLFSGIGGFRIAFERELGGTCVFSCDWDKYAALTYKANFDDDSLLDIRKVDAEKIPDHDILTAGFPCQPFSISGVSKKNSLGRPHGFDDEKQGNLFFEIEKIIKEKKPRAFVLENVRNLRNHDGGNTFRVIMETLEKKLDYKVFPEVLDAAAVVPQHRERIFIVGFREDPVKPFVFPKLGRGRPTLKKILEKKVDPKYTLSEHLWGYLQAYAEKHRQAGNGFGFGLVGPDDQARTLSARYFKDGSEILVKQRGKTPRRLTPRECARLMGFDEDFKIVVSDTQAYKQFGNSVVVPVVTAVGQAVLTSLGLDGSSETR